MFQHSEQCWNKVPALRWSAGNRGGVGEYIYDNKKFVKFWKRSWATSFFPKIRLLTRQVEEKIPHWHFWSCFHTPTSKTLADIEKFSHTSFFLKICHFLVEPLMFVPDGFLKKKVGQLLTSKKFKLLSFLQISIFFGTDVKLFGYCNYTNFHNYLNLPKIPLFSQNYGYSGIYIW